MHDFASPLMMSISCELMIGITRSDWHKNFEPWSHHLSKMCDMDVPPIVVERGLLAITGLADYFRDWIKEHTAIQSIAKKNMLDILYMILPRIQTRE